MVIEKGENIHIVERRLFSDDMRRHFCGKVADYAGSIVRATGYAWVFDSGKNQFVKKTGKRERVFCIDSRLIINVLPEGVDIDSIGYTYDPKLGHHLVTDGKQFTLDVTEFGIR